MTKSNKQFMILSTLGIIFVVDAHAWTSLNFFAGIIPYNSFFMPMFVFISGYFFDEKYLKIPHTYIWKKIKHLLVPFFCWNTIYGIMLWLLGEMGIIYYSPVINFYTLFIMPWQTGPFIIDSPAWFVPVLFTVIIVWYALRWLLDKLGIWNDYLIQIICVFIGTYTVYYARNCEVTNLVLPLLKIGFFIQFYQLGVVYRKSLEQQFSKWNKIGIMLCCLILDAILTGRYGYLSFNDLATMAGFTTDNYILPLVTSLIGIAFWLCAAEIITPVWGNNKVFNFISNNTFGIMMHHIFLFNVLNAFLYCVSRIIPAIGFGVQAYRSDPFYRMETVLSYRVFYPIFALVIYVFGKKMYLKLKNNVLLKVRENR